MVQLLEKFIPLRPPVEDRVSMLLAQLPSRLRYRNYFYTLVDPRGQWSAVEQILRMVAAGQDHLEHGRWRTLEGEEIISGVSTRDELD